MARYHRLVQEERYQIDALLRSGLSLRGIASTLNRDPATISREIKRNRHPDGRYRPVFAQKSATKRRQSIHPPSKFTGSFGKLVIHLLNQQWSPEQICGRLRLRGIRISHEAIYQFVYRDYKQGGRLFRNLRRNRRWRRSHAATKGLKKGGKAVDRLSIEERPQVVNQRKRLGDFERDLVLGKQRKYNLLTIVDRKSRLTKISKITGCSPYQTHDETVRLLRNLPVTSITNDNGTEFHAHKRTQMELGVKIYFNHPYASWERGTNENTNGLIRQYFPKGMDLRKTTAQEIQVVEDLLNSRPRKCLGYRTPNEVQAECSL